jgi:NAD-dependent SIR2 family protein deacetylase
MAGAAAPAKPTHFHELLVALKARHMLLRVYSQNVDGLELKSGLTTFGAYDTHDQSATCVPLHGSLQQMRCQSCGSTYSSDPYLDTLTSGELPTCLTCEGLAEARAELNLRVRRTSSFLRPDVVLYGEDHARGEDIAEIWKKDIGVADLLLVVGTSMKVDGIQTMIRTFAQSISRKHGKKKAPFLSSIYLNTELSSQQRWSNVFDCWVKGDCELFAKTLLERSEMQNMKGEGKQTVGSPILMSQPMEGVDHMCGKSTGTMASANRRLDLRPLWRYY